MSIIEELGINLVLALIQTVVKNPAKAAAVRAQLLDVADSIDTAYGLTPPTHS
jgi:hypothetical protein